eukprot:CAMPEP_0176290730 /NCGR_PEP_ID=MMETSP0121_2-20121125/55176_1 /TAXON_ID=160619 /ORGANISM="Kryptoperidinium foliaceum, Strain CCMP 1326" /LENGTH=48 /DNA_ID= /DNA_START= /DNA_END= /DNA_ORIENTATION=
MSDRPLSGNQSRGPRTCEGPGLVDAPGAVCCSAGASTAVQGESAPRTL